MTTKETKPKEEKAAEGKQKRQGKSTGKKKAEQKPAVYKTQIDSRLTAAVEAKPLPNRSSDMVPLQRNFDVMRRRLRALIAATKEYHEAMRLLDQKRSEVVKQITVLSENSPIFSEIGKTSNSNSLVSINELKSTQTKQNADKYQKAVIDYAIEWESVTTSRIDAEQNEPVVLQEKLKHYQDKVDGLRKKVNALQSKGKAVPDQLQEKVERNEAKLNTAWTNYENSASNFCNLLEEVTKQGWKDLCPMVKAAMEWEAQRAANDYDSSARIPITIDALEDILQEAEQEDAAKEASKPPGSPRTRPTTVDLKDAPKSPTGVIEKEEEINVKPCE